VGSTYGLIVLLGGFVLLTVLVIRGQSVFVAAPLCALLILVLSGADPIAGMSSKFMGGFADYMRQFFLIFALGAAFGKVMEDSGAAASIARGVVRVVGARWACLAVVLACAVLTYGGVSLFVVGFSVYPLAVRLFREADLPRRFIPATIAFGSVTFTMTSAGSPEIQNLIPIKFLIDKVTGEPLTDATAGWPASLIVAVVMFALGQVYLEWAIRRDLARGERFERRPSDIGELQRETNVDENASATNPNSTPGLILSLTPLVVTLIALNLVPHLTKLLPDATTINAADQPDRLVTLVSVLLKFRSEPTLAIFAGVLASLVCLWRYLPSMWQPLGDGFVNGLLAIGSTSSVVGFGTALRDLPAFEQLVDWVTHLPVDPLIGAALAVAVIAGIAGSASGGQGLALPIVKPIFVDELGVAPRALHRVVAIASGSLDTMPANGYLVMLIRNICGETHARAYGPIFVTTALIPAIGTALAIVLFKLFPSWQWM
jgi:H+/gluconate symporter-like permease